MFWPAMASVAVDPGATTCSPQVANQVADLFGSEAEVIGARPGLSGSPVTYAAGYGGAATIALWNPRSPAHCVIRDRKCTDWPPTFQPSYSSSTIERTGPDERIRHLRCFTSASFTSFPSTNAPTAPMPIASPTLQMSRPSGDSSW